MSNSFDSGDRNAAQAAVQSALDQFKTLFPDATPAELLAVVDQLQQYVDAFQNLKDMSHY